jgi:tripartite-type tricarboxylate transporter receptor subunit TctC
MKKPCRKHGFFYAVEQSFLYAYNSYRYGNDVSIPFSQKHNPETTMKPILKAALAAAALACAAGQAGAESYPSKQIVMIVPFSPGSGADLIARAYAPGIQDELKVPVVVENREGAAGLIGLLDGAHAPNDGYTIVMAAEPPLSLAPFFQERTTYDPLKAFAPLARVGTIPMILVAAPQSGVKSVADLREYAKTHAAQATYASNGNASPAQVMMELFKSASSIPLSEITYKSTNQMTTDVAGDHVLAAFLSISLGEGLVQSGKFNALAVGSSEPQAKFPGVPTLAQALGKPGYRAEVAYEFFAPAGTPDDRVQRIFKAIEKSYGTARTQATMKQLSMIPDLKTPAQLGEILRQDSTNARLVYDALQKTRQQGK